MAYLHASMWPGEHLWLYCARILVMVERSGGVWVLIQLRDPTSSWRFLLSYCCFNGGEGMSGTESTGWPLQ